MPKDAEAIFYTLEAREAKTYGVDIPIRHRPRMLVVGLLDGVGDLIASATGLAVEVAGLASADIDTSRMSCYEIDGLVGSSLTTKVERKRALL